MRAHGWKESKTKFQLTFLCFNCFYLLDITSLLAYTTDKTELWLSSSVNSTKIRVLGTPAVYYDFEYAPWLAC